MSFPPVQSPVEVPAPFASAHYTDILPGAGTKVVNKDEKLKQTNYPKQ